MSEPSKMHNGWPTYFASGHAVQRCDATTGYTVSNVAYCDTPERASELAKAHERADIAEQMAEALREIIPFIPKSSASEGGPNARSANVAAADKVRAALSAWEASNPAILKARQASTGEARK
jgi:hypothetical protein